MSQFDKTGPEFSRDREIKVLLEDLRGEFRIFGEGLQDVRKELREGLHDVRNRLERVENDIAQIKVKVNGMDSAFQRFFAQLSDHETRITTIKKSFR